MRGKRDPPGNLCYLLKMIQVRLVGERGFQPPTPWSRTRCSTRLSHSPTKGRRIAAEKCAIQSFQYSSKLGVPESLRDPFITIDICCSPTDLHIHDAGQKATAQ